MPQACSGALLDLDPGVLGVYRSQAGSEVGWGERRYERRYPCRWGQDALIVWNASHDYTGLSHVCEGSCRALLLGWPPWMLRLSGPRAAHGFCKDHRKQIYKTTDCPCVAKAATVNTTMVHGTQGVEKAALMVPCAAGCRARRPWARTHNAQQAQHPAGRPHGARLCDGGG